MAINYNELLNKEQLEAINIIDGPLVVYAGAGTGKTRTLTYRIVNMVEHDIAPSSILAITFTKKATSEMVERLFELIGPMAKMVNVSTIHSLCAKILRRDIDKLDYDKNFNIIDDDDQLKVVAEVLDNMGLDKKQYPSKKVRNIINNYKTFGIKPIMPIFMRVIDNYEAFNKELNQLDFNDLLLKTEELLVKNSDVLSKYQEKFKYILVDEFQDTDHIQYHIIAMLASKYKNIFLVGDDDQSIYGFRGSNYENIKMFKADFPEYKSVILNKNYRSSMFILDGCNRLIDKNINREKKSLVSDIVGSQNDVAVYQAADGKEEVNFVCDTISDLLKEGYEYKDIAVLYRLNSISRNFEQGFVNEGIPYELFGGVSYMQRREIKDISAYFRLICNPFDKTSFKRVVNVPVRGIGEKTVQKILDFSYTFKCTWYEAIDKLKDELKNKYSVLKNFSDNILSLSTKFDSMSYIDMYNEIVDKFDFLESVKDEDDEADRIQNIEEFKSWLSEIEDDGEIAEARIKLQSALDSAQLQSDRFSDVNYGNTVTLSTVHSVKGLEFKVVFVVALENGLFPQRRVGEDIDEEEERRVAYVACTRAKEKLFLTCATERMLYGSTIRNPRSKFLIEFVFGSNTQEIKRKVEVKSEKVDRTLPNDTAYAVGDKIIHKAFGEGIVVALNGTIGTICFVNNNEIKIFDMSHPAISKKE